MVAPTAERVPMHTAPEVNERIRMRTERDIEYFRMHPEKIDERLRELDEEWDIERGLAMSSAGFSLIGLALAVMGWRKALILPLVVQGFYLQHSLQGWCPPLPALRRMGLRTPKEIEAERHALLAIRDGEREMVEEQRAI